VADDFTHRTPRALGKAVHRLGLACNMGIDGRAFAKAAERGVNYVLWSPFRTRSVTPVLVEKLKADRERMVVATGPTLGFFRGGVRRGCEGLLRKLGTEYIDVFQLFWLGVSSALTDGTADELSKLKAEGKIRAIGVSIHDRERAGRLAADSPIGGGRAPCPSRARRR
jgi:aryl-alcohol dehydrogenase-like predicted oxidoreductase